MRICDIHNADSWELGSFERVENLFIDLWIVKMQYWAEKREISSENPLREKGKQANRFIFLLRTTRIRLALGTSGVINEEQLFSVWADLWFHDDRILALFLKSYGATIIQKVSMFSESISTVHNSILGNARLVESFLVKTSTRFATASIRHDSYNRDNRNRYWNVIR